MCVGKNGCLRTVPWSEIEKHNTRADMWIVVEEHVYDVSHWIKKHPGGARVIGHYAGQDASVAWKSVHPDIDLVEKYMKTLCVGKLENGKKNELEEDFLSLRQKLTDAGMFRPSPTFYVLQLASIIAMELVAYMLMLHWGYNSWSIWWLAVMILVTSQAQAGWSQHDYGHLSVFRSRRVNHLMHEFIIGHLKGASSHWWNFRHFQHHVKPNVYKKDPDITLPQMFLLGDKIPKKWGEQKRGKMPYHHQHQYFLILGPLLLLPTYFHYENLLFVFRRKDWKDLGWMLSFFVRWFCMYGPIFGGWNAFWLYMFVRTLESSWFVWCTQMSHIPMEVDHDNQRGWVHMQLLGTCNVTSGVIFDWFSGHLNYQIEHHLFPLMPRHNYRTIAPLVRSLCKKHNIPYVSKPTWYNAWLDILWSLKDSGHMWFEAYYN